MKEYRLMETDHIFIEKEITDVRIHFLEGAGGSQCKLFRWKHDSEIRHGRTMEYYNQICPDNKAMFISYEIGSIWRNITNWKPKTRSFEYKRISWIFYFTIFRYTTVLFVVYMHWTCQTHCKLILILYMYDVGNAWTLHNPSGPL